MASKASFPMVQPVIPTPSVAAGTMSPRSSPGGLHLNATKSLVSAVQDLKAAASAVNELNAAVKKMSPTTTAAGDVSRKASKMAVVEGDSGLGSTRKSGLMTKVASGAALEAASVKKFPAGSAAKMSMDTVSISSPKKSPTAATLASEVAKTLSMTTAAGEAVVPSKASLSAVGAAPLAPVPSIAAGTIQPRPSATSNATADMISHRKLSSIASSSSSETRRKRKAREEEKKKSEEAAGSVVSGSKALLGSKQILETATPGSTANIPVQSSVIAGSKQALQSIAGSKPNIPTTGSVLAGSKALLGSKQNIQAAAEQETEPEVELTSSPLTTEVRPLPVDDEDFPPPPPPPPPPLTSTRKL